MLFTTANIFRLTNSKNKKKTKNQKILNRDDSTPSVECVEVIDVIDHNHIVIRFMESDRCHPLYKFKIANISAFSVQYNEEIKFFLKYSVKGRKTNVEIYRKVHDELFGTLPLLNEFIGPKYQKKPGFVHILLVSQITNIGFVHTLNVDFDLSRHNINSIDLEFTGNIHERMRESLKVSLHVAMNFLLKNKLKPIEKSLHINLPDFSISKSGPSASLAAALAMVSVAINRAIPDDWTMTGELDIRGNVRSIGGLGPKLRTVRDRPDRTHRPNRPGRTIAIFFLLLNVIVLK